MYHYIPNYILGFFLRKKIKVNEEIELNGSKGVVKRVGANVVINSKGDILYFPSKYVKNIYK